jgi:hypothetical protein
VSKAVNKAVGGCEGGREGGKEDVQLVRKDGGREREREGERYARR